MERKPFSIILLALLFVVSPFIYPVLASIWFSVPIADIFRQMTVENSPLRNAEIFVLPVALGFFTFYARRLSFFIVVLGSLYLAGKNVTLFVRSNAGDPVVPFVLINLFFVLVIAFLLRRDTRMIYFDRKARWWETDPRYIVEWTATLSRMGREPMQARVKNIAIGGAAVESGETGFTPQELVQITFTADGNEYRIPASIVWQWGSVVGMQWVKGLSEQERDRIKDLIRKLRKTGVATTRGPGRWQDFKNWITRAE
jgi:hypothetical protein